MMARRGIGITHNINVGHRLWQLPGKCENIHGHSMSVKVTITGRISDRGLIFDMDLRDIKGPIIKHLDSQYDHRLLLNKHDNWSRELLHGEDHSEYLPGLRETDGDPTTENIAMWIGQWVRSWCSANVDPQYLPIEGIIVEVQETPTNSAFWVSS